MKINTLRYIDRFIGNSLGIIFSPFLLLLSKKANSENNRIKKILLIKLWGLGNLTVIWPLIYKIKDKFPKAEIMFLTFNPNRGFLEKHNAINKVIYFGLTNNFLRIITNLFFTLRIIRKAKIDLLINFETLNNTSAFFSYLSGAIVRIGLNNKYERIFYTDWVNNNSLLHISQVFSNLLRPLNINSPYTYFNFDMSLEEKENTNNSLGKVGFDKFICIHLGTSENFKGKRWSLDKFSELINTFINYYKLPVVLSGTKKEAELADSVIEKILDRSRIINTVGCLNIWDFIELLKRCFLFISNDTGPVHIAASLGINTAVFYGPTSPLNYRPLNKNSLIFYRHPKCSPCVGIGYINSECKYNFKCLEFSTQDVFSRIKNKFLL